MEINVKIEAPGLMDALLAVAEQLQELNAHQAGKPAPVEAISSKEKPKVEEKKVEPVKEEKDEAPEVEVKTEAGVDVEVVRALVIKSKSCKEKAKEVMTEMGVRKLTDMDEVQLQKLYDALQEV